jgi:hypothetical protein
MPSHPPTTPDSLVVHLSDDFNWWIAETNHELGANVHQRGVLDPRQVAHLVELLDKYEPYGVSRDQFAAAFQVYTAASELADDRLRLAKLDEPIHHTGEQLFALPLLTDDGESPYAQFLAALSAAHVRFLNTTHEFARACTELEMFEEIDALDSDRYFSEETIHTFDEINEIITWSPAEWDDSTS